VKSNESERESRGNGFFSYRARFSSDVSLGELADIWKFPHVVMWDSSMRNR
jgi:hypothetical protein